MQAWLWELWETFKAAFGVRRYLLAGWVSVGITTVAYVLLHWWGERLTLFGTTLIGLTIFLGATVVFMTLHAMELRRQLSPALKLTCDDPGCVVEAPMQLLRDGHPVSATRVAHVRVKVVTAGPTTVRQCTAGLLSVKRRDLDEGGAKIPQLYETIDLPWSSKGHKPIDIGADDKEYIDVLCVTMDANLLTPCGNTPFRLGDLFTKVGSYELQVAVKSAQTARSVPFSFVVNWNGHWNQITVAPAKDGL